MARVRDDRAALWQPDLAPDRSDDAGVSLVRHKPVDIGRAEPVRRQGLINDIAEMLHRLAKHLAAHHPEVSGLAGGGRPAVDVEDVMLAAVRMQMRRQDAAAAALACGRS